MNVPRSRKVGSLRFIKADDTNLRRKMDRGEKKINKDLSSCDIRRS